MEGFDHKCNYSKIKKKAFSKLAFKDSPFDFHAQHKLIKAFVISFRFF